MKPSVLILYKKTALFYHYVCVSTSTCPSYALSKWQICRPTGMTIIPWKIILSFLISYCHCYQHGSSTNSVWWGTKQVYVTKFMPLWTTYSWKLWDVSSSKFLHKLNSWWLCNLYISPLKDDCSEGDMDVTFNRSYLPVSFSNSCLTLNFSKNRSAKVSGF